MSYLDYGEGAGLEDILMKKYGVGGQPSNTNTADYVPPPESVPAGTATPTLSEKLMKGLQDFSPLIAQVGTSLMRGRNTVTGAPTETVGSQMGGALTSALGSMKMNEALKKMIASQLAGGGGGSFNEGQPVGLTGADVVGLSPEQVSGLYSTGVNLRAAELKRPFENIKALSESYLHIMTGEAKPAEIALHNATAQKTLDEIANMPIKNWQEWQAKEAATKKITAEIDEIKAKTEAIPTETARKVAETKKTTVETTKLGLEMNPEYTALKKRMETEYGTKLEEIRRGDQVTLTNPITGKPVLSYTIGAAPESASKIKGEVQRDITFAAGQIAPWIVPIIESNLATTKEKQQMQNLGQLLALMKPIGGGEIDVKAVKALAARIPGLASKFDGAIDAYMTSGGNESFKGQLVRSIFSEGMTPATSEKPTTEKPVTEKYKPTAAAPSKLGGLSPSEIAQIEEQATKDKKPNAIYESETRKVEVRNGKVVNVTPKKSTSTIPEYPYGTF